MAAILLIYRDALIKACGNKTLACRILKVPKLYMHKLSKIPEFKDMLDEFSRTKAQQTKAAQAFTKELFLEAFYKCRYVNMAVQALRDAGVEVCRKTIQTWFAKDPDFAEARLIVKECIKEKCDKFLSDSDEWRAKKAWLDANAQDWGYGRDNGREMTLKISHEDAIKLLAAEPEK